MRFIEYFLMMTLMVLFCIVYSSHQTSVLNEEFAKLHEEVMEYKSSNKQLRKSVHDEIEDRFAELRKSGIIYKGIWFEDN